MSIRKIKIVCPTCKSIRTFDLKIESESGIMGVFFGQDKVCEHAFHAYIDTNGEVRDYLMVDYQIKLEQYSQEIIKKGELETGLDHSKLFSLTLDFNSYILAHVLKSIFLRKNIVILLNKFNEDINKNLLLFFQQILGNNFKYSIEFSKNMSYKRNKSDQATMVIDGIWAWIGKKRLNSKTCNVSYEHSLMSLIYEHPTINTLLNIRDKLREAYEDLSLIRKSFNFQNKKVKVSKIKSFLQEHKKKEIDYRYFFFLTDLLKNYCLAKLQLDLPETSYLGFLWD